MVKKVLGQWPHYSAEEINKVSDVLKSNKVNYWTGEECKKFEVEFALWLGCEHAVAVMNGTVAIEVALRAIGVSVGDEVIVTPRSFFASVSPVVTVGAKPVFADVQLNSGNICPNSISKLITKNTKAIICVHLAGWPCDMDEIMQIAKENNANTFFSFDNPRKSPTVFRNYETYIYDFACLRILDKIYHY